VKKIILILSFLFGSIIVNAQSYYSATITELYSYNNKTESWVLYQKNSDVNIKIILEESFLTIVSKSPNMFKFSKLNAKDISGKTFTGYKYNAVDLKKDELCTIDIVKFDDTNYMISVFNTDKTYNFRYYIQTE
jgi:hypothetical protein